MHVDEADTPLLKKWIVKRLEDISDADSDVLADYVLALVKSDDPDDQVRATSLESLEDFLKEHTSKFVDDVLQTIRTKSYDSTKPYPVIQPPTGPAFNPPSGPSDPNRRSSLPGQNPLHGSANGAGDQSRKRNFNQTGLGEGQDGQFGRGPGDRAIKQMRRGGRGGIPTGPAMGTGRGNRDAHMSGQRTSMSAMPSMPTPPGFPPIDPNNPLAAMMAMQAMGFPMPGFPGMPGAGSPSFGQTGSSQQNGPPKKPGKRCRDYDTKGFCALGTSCPYEHGPDSIMVGTEEYDPTKGSPGHEQRQNGFDHARGSERGRGRGRGRGDRGGHNKSNRAAFSQAGPNFDKSNTTIVVEQIPEDKFDEPIVRDFFSEFGNITEIKMQAYKHLAIVTFDDYYAAQKAYESPKVIFDNRFVKVYWYKPDTVPTPPINGQNTSSTISETKPDEEMIDPVEFEKRQAEAQKAHEEKQKQIEAAKNEREELERKVKAQAEERKKLLEKLAAKTGGVSAGPAVGGAQSPTAEAAGEEGKQSQTEALKAKLAELEAEAERIGLPDEHSTGFRGRGRGGYRARGFPSRGRGYDPGFRGSYRGRGAFNGGARGGVMRLDNRPKKIVVTAPELTTPAKDEAFRQYLFNNYEFDAIETHPSKPSSLIVGFKERYIAEQFINSTFDVPNVGKLELTWHSGPTSTTTTPSVNPGNKELGLGSDVHMSSEANGAGTEEAPKAEMDYDVADDEDQWMAS
ncbi:hypothetical protein EJ05DRAFT_507689 [Pseudovirgaria hyperparasitica]|uniref:RNA-binding domain-containing protein n=1 Tax=Pseudovirgaria hyperparasitica TaxID=470096 RepID=A0A6A6WGX0_9PEZI|nr:uncharacterized protein EJ05DRAFT_507689 [Pseudovirgaria hyperparasitica]KAF2762102.1 hypothetical protein EJ05DRAFT_507689 [Pseudovirgaria hyperparasitica]